MTRLPQWDTVLLPAFLASRKGQPFAWGKNDCCLFAADAVQAITGVDIAADFRGKYSNHVDALTLVWKLTGKSDNHGTTEAANAAEYCAAKHGLTEYEHPKQAKRGDLVVVSNADRLIAGVVHTDGRHIAGLGEAGLLYFPISTVQRAWAV